jgi:hypothetical protein
VIPLRWHCTKTKVENRSVLVRFWGWGSLKELL